jgi:predicted HicB family RNase H-like nuclease
MIDKLIYKDFIGSLQYSAEDETFFGKIEGINDLVTFEGDSVKKINLSFKEAVNDYLELCVANNRSPFKSFKGSFNIRISPELHAKAFKKAMIEGKSLNEFVETSLQKVLG